MQNVSRCLYSLCRAIQKSTKSTPPYNVANKRKKHNEKKNPTKNIAINLILVQQKLLLNQILL